MPNLSYSDAASCAAASEAFEQAAYSQELILDSSTETGHVLFNDGASCPEGEEDSILQFDETTNEIVVVREGQKPESLFSLTPL